MSDQSNPKQGQDGVSMPAPRTPDPNESYSPKILLREKSGDDRRDSTRRSYFVGVHIAADAEATFGLTGNISAGGLFVVAEDPPPLSSMVELEFLLDDASTLVVEGEVRWVRRNWDKDERRPPGFGVEFTELDPIQHQQLAALLDELDSSTEAPDS